MKFLNLKTKIDFQNTKTQREITRVPSSQTKANRSYGQNQNRQKLNKLNKLTETIFVSLSTVFSTIVGLVEIVRLILRIRFENIR